MCVANPSFIGGSLATLPWRFHQNVLNFWLNSHCSTIQPSKHPSHGVINLAIGCYRWMDWDQLASSSMLIPNFSLKPHVFNLYQPSLGHRHHLDHLDPQGPSPAMSPWSLKAARDGKPGRKAVPAWRSTTLFLAHVYWCLLMSVDVFWCSFDVFIVIYIYIFC